MTGGSGRSPTISTLDPNYTTTYSYDAYNRLETASAGAGGSTYYRRYSYDEWGNLNQVRTSPDLQHATTWGQQANGSGVPATNRVSSVTSQLYGWTTQTVSYTWDAAGNLTNDGIYSYTYDAAGRQKEAGAVGQNTVGYDGEGMRVKKIENWGTPVYYVRSSVLKQAAMEVQGGTLARAYIYVGRLRIAQLSPDGNFYWMHFDHLGSGHKLTSASGTVVYRKEADPYGQLVLETGTGSLNSRKFTDYERDGVTGLDYARARMFASDNARFRQPDPAGLKAARLKKPQSMNLYVYSSNDPVNRTDTGGRDDRICLGGSCWSIGASTTVSAKIESSPPPPVSGIGGSAADVGMLVDDGEVGGEGDEEQQIDPRVTAMLAALKEGFDMALAALESRGACKALFGKINAVELLKAYQKEGLIRTGTSYPVANLVTRQNTILSFDPGLHAVTSLTYMQTPKSVSSVFILAGEFGVFPPGQTRVVTINSSGGFFNGSWKFPNIPDISGYSQAQQRGAAIIHELLHAAGKIPSDTSDGTQSEANQRRVLEACFHS